MHSVAVANPGRVADTPSIHRVISIEKDFTLRCTACLLKIAHENCGMLPHNLHCLLNWPITLMALHRSGILADIQPKSTQGLLKSIANGNNGWFIIRPNLELAMA